MFLEHDQLLVRQLDPVEANRGGTVEYLGTRNLAPPGESMKTSLIHPSRSRLSLRARALKALLRIMRRRRIYDSVAGLMAGIENTRVSGPARPSAQMCRDLEIGFEQIGAMEVYTLKPRKLSPDRPVMLYLHGGAYCRPITSHHWRFLLWLVTAHDCVVVVPLYPLAPESQCIATVQALRNMHALMSERHGQFDAFVGDSAGAGLCVAFCLALRASNKALPNRLVLISPFVDVSLTHQLVGDTARRDPMLGILGIREAGRLYAGDLGLDHPFVSPLQADLHDLPAMQIFVGTDDILHHDALAFAHKAKDAGCDVDLHAESGMIHVWPLLPLPEARRSRLAITRFLMG